MSDMHITTLQQPNDHTCVHTCLAMITGKPVDQLISRFGDKAIGFYEIATVLVEHRLFPVYTTEQQHPFYASGVYLVAAPSLNRPGLLHQLVIEAGPDGYIVHDPQAGREGKDFYRNEDIQSGRISRAEVLYLDPDILAGMTDRPVHSHNSHVPVSVLSDLRMALDSLDQGFTICEACGHQTDFSDSPLDCTSWVRGAWEYLDNRHNSEQEQ
ncbi:MAG: hypothetical protein R3180_00035 [Marinobacter sp.]|nr:hypothetical protein [Marinobacter sp.]